MTILCSDGYEYEDLKARLLGRPLENIRNQQIVSYRFHRKPEGFIRAFCEAFDREKTDSRQSRERGIRAANDWLLRQNP